MNVLVINHEFPPVGGGGGNATRHHDKRRRDYPAARQRRRIRCPRQHRADQNEPLCEKGCLA